MRTAPLVALAASLLGALPAAAQSDHGGATGTTAGPMTGGMRRDAHATPEMAAPGAARDVAMLHMRLTDPRPTAPGDSARAAAAADALRRGIARYQDVHEAQRSGYRPLFAGDTAVGAVIHYTNLWNAMMERTRLDPARPGSLLYQRQRDGSLRLVGAMFSAPDTFTPDQLDARVPLSVARWHLHTDLCLPRPVWDRAQWARRLDDGRPAFGPLSPVTTRAACDAVAGDFKDHIFGWMVHAMVVDNTTPAAVWGGEHGHTTGGHGMEGMEGMTGGRGAGR